MCPLSVFHTLADIDCGPLEDPENGRVELTGTTEGSTATYFCFPGYELKGVETRTCTSDGWSDSEPSCERKSDKPFVRSSSRQLTVAIALLAVGSSHRRLVKEEQKCQKF